MEIQVKAMQPVVDLYNACVNLDNFHILSKKRPFPEFRKKALDAKFVETMTAVCEIIRKYKNEKNLEQKMLE